MPIAFIQSPAADGRRLDGQARRCDQMRAKTFDVDGGQIAEPGRHDHAGRDRLAMQPFAVALAMLDRVAERCGRNSGSRAPGFALVVGDDLGLAFARARESRAPAPRIAPLSSGHVVFEPGEELGVAIAPYLMTSASPALQFAVGQRSERVGIDEDGLTAGETHRSGSCRRG